MTTHILSLKRPLKLALICCKNPNRNFKKPHGDRHVINKALAIFMALLLGSCATKFDQSSLCPNGSTKQNSGETYLITDPGDGFLSLWKNKWPWDRTHLGQYEKAYPKLELVCIEQHSPSSGMKQRQAIFKVAGANDYIFGSVKYGTTIGGVVAEADFLKAQQFVNKHVWFAARTESSSFQRIDNLKPYIVKRIELGTNVMDSSELYLVVTHQNKEVRVPIVEDESGKITVPGKVFFYNEPTPKNLNISNEEFEFIKQGRVVVGMSENSVYLSWGLPDSTNRTTSLSGTSKQLVYDPGKRYAKYIYIDRGVVTAIQD